MPLRIICLSLVLSINSTLLPAQVITGAERTAEYLPLLEGKCVGLLVNHSSRVGDLHLLDTLLRLGVEVQRVYAPEHGFRGTADAGDRVNDDLDDRTGIPIVSLYGKKLKPTVEDLNGIDIVVFDVQDVGARFYTYISTMYNMLEACAGLGIPFLVLDRPNPNGHYVDGPILERRELSFVGVARLPIVHGCTVGELANLFVGEGWIEPRAPFFLSVVRCENYTHSTFYDLPVKPSPNLPNARSILLYPSLCLFEGTVISVGRGTDWPFQRIGHPSFTLGNFVFTPRSNSSARRPLYENMSCNGYDFRHLDVDSLFAVRQLDLKPLLNFYHHFPDKKHFFLKNDYFDMLAGNNELRKQIKKGETEAEIRASWREGLDAYKAVREKYLLYAE
ncbi:MAG: DUF1343 domain-containing protein [Saprospiraceae bacterium]|nr:DUF1343 domain-containing protein [Saprospiraceae bacterium]